MTLRAATWGEESVLIVTEPNHASGGQRAEGSPVRELRIAAEVLAKHPICVKAGAKPYRVWLTVVREGGTLNFVLAANMADGTQRFVHVRS